jgi:hypothetical protein
MIQFLRLSFGLIDPETGVETSDERLVMSDQELLLLLNVVMSRDFWGYGSIDEAPPNAVYPLKLLAQKELALALAVKYAPNYDMVADNNNQLHEGQMFEHYIKLAEELDNQYKDYLDSPGDPDGLEAGAYLRSYDVLRQGKPYYFTLRNYDLSKPPTVSIKIDNVYEDAVEISWSTRNIKRLLSFKVFLSTEPIVDVYSKIRINTKSKLVHISGDPHKTLCRISKLEPDREYHIAVVANEHNGLQGLSEVVIQTLSVEQDVV